MLSGMLSSNSLGNVRFHSKDYTLKFKYFELNMPFAKLTSGMGKIK